MSYFGGIHFIIVDQCWDDPGRPHHDMACSMIILTLLVQRFLQDVWGQLDVVRRIVDQVAYGSVNITYQLSVGVKRLCPGKYLAKCNNARTKQRRRNLSFQRVQEIGGVLKAADPSAKDELFEIPEAPFPRERRQIELQRVGKYALPLSFTEKEVGQVAVGINVQDISNGGNTNPPHLVAFII